ncbi:MAG: hypothetical protein IRZ15_06840 [Bryobacteraceae bacterium]|nr:hypothetical protein [Bryobacteraceae bacterium]
MESALTRRLALLWGLAAVPMQSLPGKDPVQWKTATVLYVRYAVEGLGVPTAPARGESVGGLRQIALGEFDFDAGDVEYTAQERVAPWARLQLSEGDKVQIAIDKKNLLLKLSDGKIRKLKLTATYPKSTKRP